MLEKISENQYKLHGVLDIQHAELLPELIALGHLSKHHLHLDCDGLTSADSLLLAAILSLARQLEQKDGTLTIMNFPKHLEVLVKTYGIESLIHHYCAKE